MTRPSIENARDADLRLSGRALQRAAQRARALAIQTGTLLVISRKGVIEKIQPQQLIQSTQEPTSPYGENQ